VIGLDSNFSSTQIINDYIAGGSGTALSAIKANGYWIYDTKEFLDLIEWLRTYNNGKTASDKVSFYGFDAQKAAPAATAVQAYITTLDPTYLTTFNSVAEPFLTEFEELDQYSQDQLLKLLPELITKYTAKWNTIRDYLTSNKAKLVAQVGERTFALIEQHWKIVQLRFIQMSKLDELEGFNYRDNYMAENIGWIQQFEGNKKMILMAHAGHSGNSNATGTQMGYLLKKTYQDKYYSVGFFFNEGSVRAGGLINGQPQLGEFKTPAKSEHVITKAFANGGWSQFFLSFSSIAGKPSLVDVFNKEYDIYFIGADMENVTVKQTLGKFYDGIVFLEKVNGTTPN
jgi:erythromycin esterase